MPACKIDGVEHFYITGYDGPWQVCNGYTSFNKKYPRGYWYILNTKTGTTKIVGPVKTKGVNYFDLASEEAKTRNEKELVNV